MRAKPTLLLLSLLLLSAISALPQAPAAAESLSTIAAGGRHTCALNSTGSVQCWGRNEDGQLGNGSTTDSASPVDVVGLTEGIVDLAAGQFHTCAVSTSGGTQCWGRNAEGQLGDGAGGIFDAFSATPVNVAGLGSDVVSVTAGWFHTCVLTQDNEVRCWGKNEDGQLGDGQNCSVLLCTMPVDVVGLPGGVGTLAAGGEHSCVVTSGAALKCWGRNNEGQLGDGTDTDRTTPVNVVGLSSDVTHVALGGRHTCAIAGSLGGVKCWGKNDFGQLGDGTFINRAAPVDVTFLSVGMTDIDAGFFHSCALTSAGFAVCWGHNVFGQLGNGLICSPCTTPSAVQGLLGGVPTLHAGDFHGCAVIAVDNVKCWGSNVFGQVGDGTSGNSRLLPVDVMGIEAKPTTTIQTPTPTFTPTPIVTPIPVGGIAELPAVAAAEPRGARSSDSSAVLSVGVLTAFAGAILLFGVTTYTLRRRQ